MYIGNEDVKVRFRKLSSWTNVEFLRVSER